MSRFDRGGKKQREKNISYKLSIYKSRFQIFYLKDFFF